MSHDEPAGRGGGTGCGDTSIRFDHGDAMDGRTGDRGGSDGFGGRPGVRLKPCLDGGFGRCGTGVAGKRGNSGGGAGCCRPGPAGSRWKSRNGGGGITGAAAAGGGYVGTGGAGGSGADAFAAGGAYAGVAGCGGELGGVGPPGLTVGGG